MLASEAELGLDDGQCSTSKPHEAGSTHIRNITMGCLELSNAAEESETDVVPMTPDKPRCDKSDSLVPQPAVLNRPSFHISEAQYRQPVMRHLTDKASRREFIIFQIKKRKRNATLKNRGWLVCAKMGQTQSNLSTYSIEARKAAPDPSGSGKGDQESYFEKSRLRLISREIKFSRRIAQFDWIPHSAKHPGNPRLL